MARMKVPLQAEYPYNIGARCINKEWFSVPMPEVWKIMSEQLTFIHHAFDIEILAFVLMSNHFHLLVRTPKANLDEAMAWFMRETSRSLTRSGNRINQTYSGRYFRSLIKSPHYYLNAYKYIYHNPVKAGICRHVLDYPFSSLTGLLGKTRISFPVEEDLTLFSDITGTLNWLNETPKEEHWESVRKALRKKEFKLAPLNKKKHPLEELLL